MNSSLSHWNLGNTKNEAILGVLLACPGAFGETERKRKKPLLRHLFDRMKTSIGAISQLLISPNKETSEQKENVVPQSCADWRACLDIPSGVKVFFVGTKFLVQWFLRWMNSLRGMV